MKPGAKVSPNGTLNNLFTWTENMKPGAKVCWLNMIGNVHVLNSTSNPVNSTCSTEFANDAGTVT